MLSGLRRWLVLWGTAVSIALFVCVMHHQEIRAIRPQATALRTQSSMLRRLKGESDEMESRLRKLQSRESLLATSKTSHSPFQLLGVVSRCTQNGQSGVSVCELELAQETRSRTAAKKPAKGTGTKDAKAKSEEEQEMVLRLRGNAVNDLAIAGFVKSLRASSVFKAVQLKSTEHVELLGLPAREYKIDCTL